MVRRLRFECGLASDESIVGAVFRSASRHVLATVFPVFKEANISRKSIRFMQLLPGESINSIADVIRCDPARLSRDAGVRQGNAGPDERGRQRVAFGDLVIEGCHLEHRRRRVSPISLKDSSHHKTDWLNLLLPYCPSSLDLLLNTCPSCSGALGWTRPVGVECCEHCEHDLRNSPKQMLEPALTADYRSFAELCSLDHKRRRKIIDRLPLPLRTTPPGTLVRFALHAGQLVLNVARVPETHFVKLPPTELARIVSAGMRILTDWPNHFNEWMSAEARATSGDHARYSALKSDLLQLARRIEHEPGGGELIDVVLPDIVEGASGTHAILREHYSLNEAKKRLGVDHTNITKLRDVVDCTSSGGEGLIPLRYLFNASRIDQIAVDLERCVHHWHFWKTFRLPSYGVEQLVCLDLIEGISDPAIVALKNEVMIPRDELGRLAKLLAGRRRKGAPPRSVKSLRVLANGIGGRLKPWGPIFQLLIGGALPFWLKTGGVSTQHILIDPQDWSASSTLCFERGSFPAFPFKTMMNNCDMGEVLNLQPSETKEIRESKLLQARAYKRSLRYDVEQVLKLAQDRISMTELMRRSDWGDRAMRRELSAKGVPSTAGLWDRMAAETVSLATGCEAG